MTDKQLKFLVNRICKQTADLSQMLVEIKGEIAALSLLVVEAAPIAERERLSKRAAELRQWMSNVLSEWPPPEPPFGDSE